MRAHEQPFWHQRRWPHPSTGPLLAEVLTWPDRSWLWPHTTISTHLGDIQGAGKTEVLRGEDREEPHKCSLGDKLISKHITLCLTRYCRVPTKEVQRLPWSSSLAYPRSIILCINWKKGKRRNLRIMRIPVSCNDSDYLLTEQGICLNFQVVLEPQFLWTTKYTGECLHHWRFRAKGNKHML